MTPPVFPAVLSAGRRQRMVLSITKECPKETKDFATIGERAARTHLKIHDQKTQETRRLARSGSLAAIKIERTLAQQHEGRRLEAATG
jgi:hypothetical protein